MAELILQNRMYVKQRPSPARKWTVFAIAIMMMIAFGWVSWLIAGIGGKPVDWTTFWDRFIQKMTTDSWEAWKFTIAIVVAALHMIYIGIVRRRERLILTETDIRYVSPFPPALQFLQRSWSLQWSQIRRIEFKQNFFGARNFPYTLSVDAGTVKRAVQPFLWIDPANFQPPSIRDSLLRVHIKKPDELIADAMKTPLVEFIQKLRRSNLEITLPETRKPFALEKNPVALGTAAIFLACIIYFVAELAVSTETYIDDPLFGVYITGGAAFCMIAVLLMRRAKVPLLETIAVAVMAGAAFGAALYPGLLRLNQFTDTNGVATYEYKMTGPVDFIPLQAGLPELHFHPRFSTIWASYKIGYVEKFKLRKGGLGFYQIDMRPIYEKSRGL